MTPSHRPRAGSRRWLAASFLVLALGAIGSARTAAAQEVLDRKSASELLTRYLADLDTVHVKIVALAEAIPADKYAWRPTPETRSVAEALMHVAVEWYFWTPRSVGGQPPADFGAPRETIPKLEHTATKAEVLDHLEKSWAHCRAQVAGADAGGLTHRMKIFGQDMTLPTAMFIMSGDLHEHLGQLVTYTRSVGEVPPWSKKAS